MSYRLHGGTRTVSWLLPHGLSHSLCWQSLQQSDWSMSWSSICLKILLGQALDPGFLYPPQLGIVCLLYEPSCSLFAMRVTIIKIISACSVFHLDPSEKVKSIWRSSYPNAEHISIFKDEMSCSLVDFTHVSNYR